MDVHSIPTFRAATIPGFRTYTWLSLAFSVISWGGRQVVLDIPTKHQIAVKQTGSTMIQSGNTSAELRPRVSKGSCMQVIEICIIMATG